jgi:hypothetical protein
MRHAHATHCTQQRRESQTTGQRAHPSPPSTSQAQAHVLPCLTLRESCNGTTMHFSTGPPKSERNRALQQQTCTLYPPHPTHSSEQVQTTPLRAQLQQQYAPMRGRPSQGVNRLQQSTCAALSCPQDTASGQPIEPKTEHTHLMKTVIIPPAAVNMSSPLERPPIAAASCGRGKRMYEGGPCPQLRTSMSQYRTASPKTRPTGQL